MALPPAPNAVGDTGKMKSMHFGATLSGSAARAPHVLAPGPCQSSPHSPPRRPELLLCRLVCKMEHVINPVPELQASAAHGVGSGDGSRGWCRGWWAESFRKLGWDWRGSSQAPTVLSGPRWGLKLVHTAPQPPLPSSWAPSLDRLPRGTGHLLFLCISQPPTDARLGELVFTRDPVPTPSLCHHKGSLGGHHCDPPRGTWGCRGRRPWAPGPPGPPLSGEDTAPL